jgi:hypothetical protein
MIQQVTCVFGIPEIHSQPVRVTLLTQLVELPGVGLFRVDHKEFHGPTENEGENDGLINDGLAIDGLIHPIPLEGALGPVAPEKLNGVPDKEGISTLDEPLDDGIMITAGGGGIEAVKPPNSIGKCSVSGASSIKA